MFKRCRSLLCMMLVLSATLAADKVGDWTVTPIKNGLFTLKFRDRTLITQSSLSFFKQHYKGTSMALNTLKSVSEDGTTYTWHKKNSAGEATFILQIKGNTATMTTRMVRTSEGPTELGFHLDETNFENEQQAIFGKADNTVIPFVSKPFRNFGASKLTFDLPEERHTFRNHTIQALDFTLQDRRATTAKSIRYIVAKKMEANVPIESKLSWTVDTFTGKEAKQRSIIYKKPTRIVTEMNIENEGFEDGFKAWDKPAKNVSIDTTAPRSGNNAAKLTVNDPMTDNVYITRKVKIVPGANYVASCFVKTENITAVQGKRATVGAGLIVEWSDKNGKWLAAGVYACGLYGTENWQQVTCKDLRAPDDAGYAEIFLAVRAKGTAWFDDFAMTQIEKRTDKSEPLPDETIATNTPLFKWLPISGANEYTLTIAKTPDCKNPEYSFKLPPTTTFQLEKPLAPGTWYWKVDASGSPDTEPWSFTHSVPVTKDCLPPTINTKAKRILNASDPLTISVTDKNSTAQPTLKISIGDTTILPTKVTPTGNNGYDMTFQPKQGWPKGFTTLKLQAIDSSGNTTEADFWLLNAPKPSNEVIIDKNGRYSSNGKTIFPFGIYEVTKRDMLEVRRAGIDAVHTYRWEGSRDDVGCRKYLDDCWEAEGLRAFIGFDRKAICNAEFEVVAKRVGALADHPGLFCWYLFDEPEIPKQYVSPSTLTAFADLIRELDPYHTVVMTTWGRGMNKYRRTWDTHWTQAYYTPDRVIKQIDEHRRFLNNDSPITLLVHCYDKKQSAVVRSGGERTVVNFEPDKDWMRCAALAGYTQDVNGLWWWWFARYSRDYVTAAQFPSTWKNYCDVLKELKSLQSFLDSPELMVNGRTTIDDQLVTWCVKPANGKKLVIIANTGTNPIDIDLELTKDLPRFKTKLGRYGVLVKVFD